MKRFIISLVVLTVVLGLSVSCGGGGYLHQPPPPVAQYSLTVAVNGQGTTSPSTGTYTYSEGQSVTITAIPVSGWQFDHWSGDASGTDASVYVTMDSNKSVIANFTRQPQPFGPTAFNIGTGSGDFTIPPVDIGDRVEFNFSVAGSLVYYSVRDPYGNIVLTGSGGNKVASGGGSFIASSPGFYELHFVSSGIVTPSVITVDGTIYFASH